MNEFFYKKESACRLFLIFVFVFSSISMISSFGSLKKILLEELSKEGKVSLANINLVLRSFETEVNESIWGKYAFIEVFGYLQLLMNKNEQSNFETVKDKRGILHNTYFSDKPKEVKRLAENVKNFKEAIVDDNVRFLYLLTPDKYVKGQTEFPTGMPYNFENEAADEFLQLLENDKIDTVDLRKDIVKSGLLYDEIFYKTDHHWKIESCFWAFTQLVNVFNTKYGMRIDRDGFYTNIDNYNVVTYPNSYIGLLGRKVGKYYSGVDDFTIIYPKFKTNLEFSIGYNSLNENKLSGLFEDIFISSQALRNTDEPYASETDKYSSYLLGNQGVAHIRNSMNPNGLKVAFVKDSMVVPVIGFLSSVCSDIYFIDPIYYSGDIREFVNGLELDFVIVSFCPLNITEQTLSF